jgi:hypothetical protein
MTLYRSVWPKIVAHLGRINAPVPAHPRARETLFHRILANSDYRFHCNRFPAFCPHCERSRAATKRLPILLAELAEAQEDDVQEDVDRLLVERERVHKEIKAGDRHKEMDKRRRKWSQEKRQTLAADEVLIFIDFYSFFSADQLLVHTLCFVIETKAIENGKVNRLYVDFPCLDSKTNKANHYYIAVAWLYLLEKTDIIIDHSTGARLKYQQIWICCDNAIVSKFHQAALVALHKLFRIRFSTTPLCPRHASSLADSHAGHVKPHSKKVDLKNASDEDISSAFLGCLDSGEPRLKNTRVFPLKTIEHTDVDARLYNFFGGVDNIRSIPGLRSFGHLQTVRGQGENPGFVRARTNVGEHYPWPYVGACPDRYQDEGWCIAPLTKHPGVNLCGKCSHIHGRPTWADDEHKRTCLFSALDGDAEDEDAAPDAVAGDAQQPPLPAERESQVWSANDTEWESTDLSVKFDDKGWPVFGDAAEGTHVVVTTQSGFEVVIYCSRDDDTLGSIFSLHGNGLEKHVHFKLAMEYAVFVNAQLSKRRSRKLKAKTLVAFPCHATERALGAFPEPTHASKPKKRVATAAPGTAGGKPMGTGAGVEESNIILSKRRK